MREQGKHQFVIHLLRPQQQQHLDVHAQHGQQISCACCNELLSDCVPRRLYVAHIKWHQSAANHLKGLSQLAAVTAGGAAAVVCRPGVDFVCVHGGMMMDNGRCDVDVTGPRRSHWILIECDVVRGCLNCHCRYSDGE